MMSVWPHTISPAASLVGSDGVLVSVSINVAPRHLESLLEALAQVDFPVNPQIYHDAAITYYYEDGPPRIEPTTLVEFPAYADRLNGLRGTLEACGFDPECASVAGMLDGMHAEGRLEPAPAGAPYRARSRRKLAGLVRTAILQ
jgi:hypothetical protein